MIEVYVDDMITKSKSPNEHVMHLEETFELLRKYKMKLNPSLWGRVGKIPRIHGESSGDRGKS